MGRTGDRRERGRREKGKSGKRETEKVGKWDGREWVKVRRRKRRKVKESYDKNIHKKMQMKYEGNRNKIIKERGKNEKQWR